MAYRLSGLGSSVLSAAEFQRALDEHRRRTVPVLERYWRYYRNPAAPRPLAALGEGPGVGAIDASDLAQAQGLPERFARAGREVVIENDIAWRVHAMVDFMFGKPIRLRSTARDERTRGAVDRVLARTLEHSGGVSLLQELALLGHVYGHVDLLVHAGDALRGLAPRDGAMPDDETLERAAGLVRVEVIEPRRGIAFLKREDYRQLRAYAIRTPVGEASADAAERVDVISGERWQRYRGGRLAGERAVWWSGGRVPVVHIQNLAQPFRYEGIGEVEPLIPLQDELNTRLSDRAHRVTMQSFKVFLARGFDPGQSLSIGPGSVIVSESPEAQIEEFGGSTHDAGEDRHIEEIREAMDKASAVPPIAAGAIQAKFGNLSSGNALRIALMGVVAKTSRKRVTYGAGLARAAELVLCALDAAGVLPTAASERGVEIDWPETVPGEEGRASGQ